MAKKEAAAKTAVEAPAGKAGKAGGGPAKAPVAAKAPAGKAVAGKDGGTVPAKGAPVAAPDAPSAAKPGSALARPVRPSAELAAIVGPEPLPRTAVTSKVWEHIKAGGLQDPADKRTIVADDKLRAVFGKDRATMFEMNKLLSAHMTAA